MDNKQLLAIILAIIIAGLIISIGCFYGLNQNNDATNITNNVTNTTNITASNMTNNTTDVDTDTQVEESDTYYEEEEPEKLEFNGKTHEQNIEDAKRSRDEGGQWAGATDEQIEEMVSKEERDGGRI